MDRFFLWLMWILSAAAFGLIVWCVALLIQGPWYGTGTVVDKTYSASHMSLISCGKSTCPYTVPECYRLTVREHNGDEHVGCVRAKVWEDTAIGRTITLNKQTGS